MGKLTEFGSGFSSAPIGLEGVQSYVDMMNCQHPHAPYIWRVGSRMGREGQPVRCVEVVRKSELRTDAPRVSGKAALRLVHEATEEMGRD